MEQQHLIWAAFGLPVLVLFGGVCFGFQPGFCQIWGSDVAENAPRRGWFACGVVLW
ncbi:MAG: hypothetical protein Q4C71_05965 [Microbacteriaceae bacterium]|nr:hypothetical protein [Microbacteriaceae bacterium]